MPLKLVPSGACEGASFLALSDHEVTATPMQAPLSPFARQVPPRAERATARPATTWARHAKRLPHKPRTKHSNCPPRKHERRAGADPREIAQ